MWMQSSISDLSFFLLHISISFGGQGDWVYSKSFSSWHQQCDRQWQLFPWLFSWLENYAKCSYFWGTSFTIVLTFTIICVVYICYQVFRLKSKYFWKLCVNYCAFEHIIQTESFHVYVINVCFLFNLMDLCFKDSLIAFEVSCVTLFNISLSQPYIKKALN